MLEKAKLWKQNLVLKPISHSLFCLPGRETEAFTRGESYHETRQNQKFNFDSEWKSYDLRKQGKICERLA